MKVEHVTDLDAETDKALQSNSRSDLRHFRKARRASAEWLLIRKEGGTLGAGCRIILWQGWVDVLSVWVDPGERGKGYGKELLKNAEERARSQGLMGLEANLYSFESPNFFIKCGYSVIARLKINADGVERLWLVKSFEPLPDTLQYIEGNGRRRKKDARKSTIPLPTKRQAK